MLTQNHLSIEPMQSFNLNNKQVRFFTANETIYLITADANKAFGFEGETTSLDKNSVILSSLEISIHESFMLSDGIQSNSLVIEFKNVVLVIIRSSKSELVETQDLFCQMVVNTFTQRSEPSAKQQALPPVSDIDRVDSMAKAVCKRYHGSDIPQDKVNLPDWLTVTEMLVNLGEDADKDSGSLVHDHQFRFWINRQMSDVYRAQTGEEAPTVQRQKGSGYCYPASFFGLVKLYRSNWLITQI